MDTVTTTGAARTGDWMITFTGRRFYPLDPRPQDVDFRDVGHALSLACRYGGHVRRFYSVAEHCTLLAGYFLARHSDTRLARAALLHDSDEAYIGDMIRPLKRFMPGFAEAGGLIQACAFVAAGLAPGIPQEVHDADSLIIGDEARELFRPETLAAAQWVPVGGLGVQVVGHPPHVAEREFTSMFVRLFPEIALP